MSTSLSDPVVTNRFALFAIWTGALTALPALIFALRLWALFGSESGRLLGGESGIGVAGVVLVTGIGALGGAASICLALSFFPPAFWTNRLQRPGIGAPG